MADTVEGSCLCGAVRFEIDLPSKWCAHCLCTMCRRAHAAPYVTWIGLEADRFRITAGEDELRAYASSPPARRRFCGVCGSQVTFESSQWPGEVHVARALVPGDIDRQPQGNAFTDQVPDWVQPADPPKSS